MKDKNDFNEEKFDCNIELNTYADTSIKCMKFWKKNIQSIPINFVMIARVTNNEFLIEFSKKRLFYPIKTVIARETREISH